MSVEYKILKFQPEFLMKLSFKKKDVYKRTQLDEGDMEVKFNQLGKDGWRFVKFLENRYEGSTFEVLVLFERDQ
jgi:hypothetical protein